MIVFDVEIKKGILMRGDEPLPGIEYCAGWRDFANMGVACVCTYDTYTSLSRTFDDTRMADLAAYLATDVTGGFNTKRFDIPLLEANGCTVNATRHFDALEQIWLKLNLNPDQFDTLHKGWGLDAVCQATFGLSKTGHGAMAPVWWQRGEISRVIDYCLNDVWLEGKLCMHILNGGTVSAAGKEPLHFTPRMFTGAT